MNIINKHIIGELRAAIKKTFLCENGIKKQNKLPLFFLTILGVFSAPMLLTFGIAVNLR